jgi:hypothetical protein
MAARKRRDPDWREHVVLVKKTHPTARSTGQARFIARRHARGRPRDVEDQPRQFRITMRPKRCFVEFRGQARPHVTVVWGRLKAGAAADRACR